MMPSTATIAEAGPAAHYAQALEQGLLQADPNQARAVHSLQGIYSALTQPAANRRWFGRRKSARPKGLYMYGGVGRGKTMLMDMLAADLPPGVAHRAHFHHFMGQVHAAIKQHADQPDPLLPIAKDLAQQCRVLCFDEFFVSDVADAMILGRLIQQLFAQGLALVATSNQAPQDLYTNGLQRSRFLPAIDALEAHCEVLNVDGGTDYRLRELTRAHTYHFPLGGRTNAILEECYSHLTGEAPHPALPIDVLGREIAVEARAHDVAWFRFSELCEGPRAAADYIELAREFGTILLQDVPQMDYQHENEARRFLHLVDEFYDRRVKLILSAAVPMNQLYTGQRLAFEFARALSRLEEMQTEDYLAQPHRPV